MDQENRKLGAFAVDDVDGNTQETPEEVAEQEAKAAIDERPAFFTAELPENSGEEIPDWVVMPPGLKVPRGRQVIFMLIKAQWTHAAWKGDRQCICWTLSDSDEKVANKRCKGDTNRTATEYTKQMLRGIDGVLAAWDKGTGQGSVDEFWREIGPKGRTLLMRVYHKTHLPDDDEVKDFFERCIAVRTAS